MRITLQAAAIAVLTAIAVLWFVAPGHAAESCTNWVTDMQEDEGGPVLTTHVCSDDPGQAYLAMLCSDGTIWLRYDLAANGDGPKEPDYDDGVKVEFVTDEGIEVVPMVFQEMDAMFAGETPADGNLIRLLKSSKGVLVREQTGAYPARTYSLKGSSAAITRLVSACC